MTAHPYHAKLAKVLERMGGLYTVQDILDAIASGRLQGFVEGDSWVITQVAVFPRAKVVEMIAMIGSGDDMMALHDKVLAFAAEIGATVVQGYGRKGWAPHARKLGWKVAAENFVYQRDVK